MAEVTTIKAVFTKMKMFLKESEKNFHRIKLWINYDNYIPNDFFSGITFEIFEWRGYFGYRNIGNETFGKSAETITQFDCLACELSDSNSYLISKFPNLNTLAIGLIDDEILPNSFSEGSNIKTLILSRRNNLEFVVRAEAFQNLNSLQSIEFQGFNVIKFKRGAFDQDLKLSNLKNITFCNLNLKGDSFENGTFDNDKMQNFWFIFRQSNIDYIPESSFKTFLNHESNEVFFDNSYSTPKPSLIDCNHCKNYWLIRDNKQNQVKNTKCKGIGSTQLFDPEIIQKLKTKCKWLTI